MEETIVYPPRTIMEVFKMLPEGTLAEVIDNTLYMSPTPTIKHQRLSRILTTQIDNFLSESKLGEMFYAPWMYTWTKIIQPYSLIFLYS